MLQSYPFLLEEEETYEHPEDPESGIHLVHVCCRTLITPDRPIS